MGNPLGNSESVSPSQDHTQTTSHNTTATRSFSLRPGHRPQVNLPAFPTIRTLADAKRARLRLAVKRFTTEPRLLVNNPGNDSSWRPYGNGNRDDFGLAR